MENLNDYRDFVGSLPIQRRLCQWTTGSVFGSWGGSGGGGGGGVVTKCSYCGSTSHASANCPYRYKCTYCGQYGHLIGSCPKKVADDKAAAELKAYQEAKALYDAQVAAQAAAAQAAYEQQQADLAAAQAAYEAEQLAYQEWLAEQQRIAAEQLAAQQKYEEEQALYNAWLAAQNSDLVQLAAYAEAQKREAQRRMQEYAQAAYRTNKRPGEVVLSNAVSDDPLTVRRLPTYSAPTANPDSADLVRIIDRPWAITNSTITPDDPSLAIAPTVPTSTSATILPDVEVNRNLRPWIRHTKKMTKSRVISPKGRNIIRKKIVM